MFIICHYLDDVSKISKAGKILKLKKKEDCLKIHVSNGLLTWKDRILPLVHEESEGGGGGKLRFTLVRFPSQHIL